MGCAVDASPEPKDVLWSIADVERDTGLGKDTLRVWERRYGFPTPTRDAFGERQYDHAQLLRLRLIKRLMDAGHRPGKVVGLPLEALEALCDEAAGRAAACPVKPTESMALDPQWIEWLRRNDVDRLRHALQREVMRQGLGAAVERLVAPLCVAVGDAWLRGDVSVFQEHLFSETVRTVLRDAIAAVEASGQELMRRPKVLLTTTPSESHTLGLLMAESFFALEACQRVSLGASTPVPDIVSASRQLGVDVVALSFSAHASRREVLDSLRQLADQLPEGVEVWVGGAAAVLYRKVMPPPVRVLGRASDVTAQVAAWRTRHSAR